MIHKAFAITALFIVAILTVGGLGATGVDVGQKVFVVYSAYSGGSGGNGDGGGSTCNSFGFPIDD
jgi:hypothetical protein